MSSSIASRGLVKLISHRVGQFGEVFITSPNAQSVSSVDIQSDWVLVGCDSKSDQPQTILAYCSMNMGDENAGCGHVFIGQAEHTIVRPSHLPTQLILTHPRFECPLVVDSGLTHMLSPLKCIKIRRLFQQIIWRRYRRMRRSIHSRLITASMQSRTKMGPSSESKPYCTTEV